MTTAEQSRDAVLDAVSQAHPGALDRALDVITAWADRGRPFSANDCRPDMDAACVPTPVRGTAFAHARRRGVIRSVGAEASTDVRTHAKRIERYVAASVPEPRLDQARDDRGRFDAPVPPGQMTFEEAS